MLIVVFSVPGVKANTCNAGAGSVTVCACLLWQDASKLPANRAKNAYLVFMIVLLSYW
jgi:hypothetical protein